MILAWGSRIVASRLRFKVAVLVIAKSLLISGDLCHVGSMVVFRRLWITLLGITAADAGLESTAPYPDIKVMRQEQIESGRGQIRWIKELTKKVGSARRFGRNPEMLAQLQYALQTYQNAIRERRLEEWYKNNKTARGEPDIGDLINIE